MKTLVIGLGNPILGDDGVGWRVAEEVQKWLSSNSANPAGPGIEVDCVALGGLSLMERLTGAELVVIIDAMDTKAAPVGTVRNLLLGDLPDLSSGHTTAVHDTSLRNALSIGRSMGIPLPEDDNIHIVAIEAEAVHDFSEVLSPAVQGAIPAAVSSILMILNLS